MSYWTISRMAADNDLTQREAAAAAQELPHDDQTDPMQWALNNGLRLAAEPGWAGAWESAVAAGITAPGRDESVITDAQILSGVQDLLNIGGG